MAEITVRLLGAEHAEALWNLRLEALEREPRAFAESAAEHRQTTPELFAQRLRDTTPGNFVAGAFDGEALSGMAGFLRMPNAKSRHKGRVWGMYVSERLRGRGAGRRLLRLLLETARELDGLEVALLSAAEDNLPAIGLYRSEGFEQYGREPSALRVDSQDISELLFRKSLR